MHNIRVTYGPLALSFTVSESTTVQELKTQIADVCHISTNHQKLYFNGMQLGNNRTLADYYVAQGAEIALALEDSSPESILQNGSKQDL